jgi:Fe-coproporphyrin III synthase
MFKRIKHLGKKVLDRFMQGNKNLLLAKTGQLKPRWIWFETTDSCNSHCTHCQIWKKKSTSNPLSLAELEKIFRDPLLKEVEAITNSGGESMLRDDIVQIIELEHLIFPHASLDLSTNGILAERGLKVVNEILAKNIKINVGVSLDGLGVKHDLIRGVPGNFDKVDHLLRRLVELRKKYPELLSIVAGFTLSDLTLDNHMEVKKYCDELGIDFSMQWFNQSSFYDNVASKKENNQGKMIEAVSCQPKTLIREKWLRLLQGKGIKFNCFAARTFFVLKCDGSVVPCLSCWDDIMGNARSQSMTEIWQSAKAVEARKKVLHCAGCLNSWGVEWSASTTFYPRLMFYLRNPAAIFDRLKRRD